MSHILFHLCVDPDDRVYPRASSRVGARYQAVVVKWDGPGQILVTSTIFDDPQNNLLKSRTKKGGRGGRPPSNKLKVPEGKVENIHLRITWRMCNPQRNSISNQALCFGHVYTFRTIRHTIKSTFSIVRWHSGWSGYATGTVVTSEVRIGDRRWISAPGAWRGGHFHFAVL